MYLLDWLTPKRLEEPINTIYDMWVGEMEPPVNNRNKDKIHKAVRCFVYNACYWSQYGVDEIEVVMHKNSYSEQLIYNCNRVNRKVSWKYSTELFQWLHNKGLATLTSGYVESWDVSSGVIKPSKRTRSSLKLSSELLGVLLPPKPKEPLRSLQSVIEVRGKDGKPTSSLRLGQDQKRIVETLECYNLNIRDCVIEVDSQRFLVQAKKVYNLDWDSGGRTYLTGPQVTGTLLKKTNRGKIMIDGEPTVTLDYKHLHPSIIAVKQGVVFEEGFDPYQIELDGYEPTALRRIAKVALLCMVNAKNQRAASSGLSWDLYDNVKELQEWKDSDRIPQVVGVKAVMEALEEHNKYAEPYLYSGFGLTLQNIDGRIIDYIMNYWNQKGISLIPLHDSVTIQSQYAEECLGVMRDAYENEIGTLDNCIVTIE